MGCVRLRSEKGGEEDETHINGTMRLDGKKYQFLAMFKGEEGIEKKK